MSPMDRTRYPKNWSEISRRIRDQAGNRCQFCDVPNGTRGCRDSDGTFIEGDGSALLQCDCDVDRCIQIVLTVAHLDHDTTNNSDDNLRALCQRCHNRHDRPYRNVNAARTRAAKKVATGQMEISV